MALELFSYTFDTYHQVAQQLTSSVVKPAHINALVSEVFQPSILQTAAQHMSVPIHKCTVSDLGLSKPCRSSVLLVPIQPLKWQKLTKLFEKIPSVK